MNTTTKKRFAALVMTMCMILSLMPNVALGGTSNYDDFIAAVNSVVTNESAAADTEWGAYLAERFYYAVDGTKAAWSPRWNLERVDTGWTWNGGGVDLVKAAPVDENTQPDFADSMPYTTGTGEAAVYYIWSGEQLKYALDECSNNGGTIELQADIDLNGHNGEVWNGISLGAKDTSINGNGYTIYNLCAIGSATGNTFASLISSATGSFAMINLSFDCANICSTRANIDRGYTEGAAIVNQVSSEAAVFENVDITNSIFVGRYYVGGLVGRFDGGIGTDETAKHITGCSIEDSVSFGNTHVGSLTGPVVSINKIGNCYSVGCKVLSTGGHSGGLFSCCGSVLNIKSCFVEAEVYGNEKTGVFTGAVSGNGMYPSRFSSCYSSGFVEGQSMLGGFTGDTEGISYYNNCYSTALVGLRSSGKKLGGFVGNCDELSGRNIYATNCYAAGEVGSVDTLLEGDNNNNGGFIGFSRTKNGGCTAVNCYYDKQSTAMREKGIGNTDADTSFVEGVTGVLTTDSKKSGNGLMSDPTGATKGFIGFTDNSLWVFDAKNEHYPELAVFQNATAADWSNNDDTAALVRAYSKSSTSGVQLETWDFSLNEDNGKLETANNEIETYDTVRDIVNGFLMTSSGNGTAGEWIRIGTADSKKEGGAKVTIADKEYNVLSLKYQNKQWLCDELMTGIEWLMVSCEVDGQTATRRLRVIPTCAIDAGKSAVITDSYYDHADDVALLFSTASRMAKGKDAVSGEYDVTTGIYPDKSDFNYTAPLVSANALTDTQKRLMQHGRTALTNEQEINDFFETNTGNDAFSNAAVSYMSKNGDNAENGALYAYLYEVINIDDDGKIKTKDTPIDLNKHYSTTEVADVTYALQLNGYAKLPNEDKQYLMEYAWKLKDSRVLMDAKLIRTAEVPFDVSLNVYKNSYDPSNPLENLYTGGVKTYAGTATAVKDIKTMLTASATARATDVDLSGNSVLGVNTHNKAAAAWKLNNSKDTLKSLTLTLGFSGKTYYKTLDANDIKTGKTIDVEFIVYRIVYQNGGYFTIPETVVRSYSLNQSDGVYYLQFIKDEQAGTSDSNGKTDREVTLEDVECNIRVDVVVSPSPSDGGKTPTTPLDGGGTVKPLNPKVNVTKKSTHITDAAANRIVYTLTATNGGSGKATGVYVKDYIPEYTKYYSVDKYGDYGILQNGKEYVSWFIDTLAAGEIKTMTFTVTVDDCVPEGISITNTGLYENTGSTTPPAGTKDPANSTNTITDSPGSDLSGAGTAALIKVDSNDQSTVLAGARFRLFHINGGTPSLVGTYTTDKNGQIRVNELNDGDYYWVEIGSPAGYKLDASEHSFTLSNTEASALTITNERTEIPEWLNGIDHFAYIVGYPEGDVLPMHNITRAEVATIFFRLLEDDVRDRYITRENSFSDVERDMWFNRAVSTMAAMGIVNGYLDGTFNPNGSITRAEFAAVAARFDLNGNTSPASFTDIYNHWGHKEISIAANNGWVLGYEDETFRPDQYITRAEAMAMVDRVLQRVPQYSYDLLDVMVKWPDNADTKTWYYLYVQEATNSHFFNRKLNGYETWTELRPVREWILLER